MKKLLMLSAVLAAALSQPAMASTCHDCDEASEHSKLHAQIDAESEKAAVAKVHIMAVAESSKAAEAGWPCDETKNRTKVAMRAAADAIAQSGAKASSKAAAHECDCEDCEEGLCTEAKHKAVAPGAVVECVEQARSA